MTGPEIRKLRHRMGLSLRDFAEVMGVAFTTVANWEKERTQPGRVHREMLEQLREEVRKEEKAENARRLGKALLSLAAGFGLGAVIGTIFKDRTQDPVLDQDQ